MINWCNFDGFFRTGIPSHIIYSSLFVTTVFICCGLFVNRIANKTKYTLVALLFEYSFIVVCSTIICREEQSFDFSRLELMPFWTYKVVLSDDIPGVSIWDIILNVVLFVPLGFLVKLCWPSVTLVKMLLIALVCSLFIETNQYVFEKGLVQFDDLMHNVIGGLVGWICALILLKANSFVNNIFVKC